MTTLTSITGKRWIIANPDDRQTQAIMQKCALPDVVARILAWRGVTVDTVDEFLDPQLRQLPDPANLQDMDLAAAILADAVESQKTIGILGDYDVDGATSTVLIINYIRALGGKSVFHIPNRFREGYGPSALGLDRLIELGADLVVTVDCGITATDLLDEYIKKIPILIVDHHQPGPELPKANAIVNPNRFDDDFPHKNLAACGVVFMLLIALNRNLRARGFFRERVEPDLKSFLDLVALGTVADIVSLTGLNRIFVKRGLEVMATRNHVGLRALSDVSRLDTKPDAYHLGFMLGPRINAAGRLQDASLGVRLLTATEEWQAREIATQLDKLNTERQAIEETILAQAIDQVEREQMQSPILVAANENWHPGVIGIVASRLKDRYARPACMIAFIADGNGQTVGTGSARSVTGFNLGAAIIAAEQSGILQKGGGHAMAAGFKIESGKLAQFREFMQTRFAAETAGADLSASLAIDASVNLAALNDALLQKLNTLAPFGMGNPQPRFMIPNVQIEYAEVMKEKHVRLRLKSLDGAGMDAVAFRVMDSPLGKFLSARTGAQIHVAGHLRENHFNGRRKLQFQIEDAAAVG